MERMVTVSLLREGWLRKQFADLTDSGMEAMWTVWVGHGAFGEEGGTSWSRGIGGHGRTRKDVVWGQTQATVLH